MIAGPRYFAALAERVRWDPEALNLITDSHSWSTLKSTRRARLTVLLAGFSVAESQVANELTPFGPAARDPEIATVFCAQQADERRHCRLFERIATAVLGAPQEPGPRQEFVRLLTPPPLLELFERRLEQTASALSRGDVGLGDGVALYHLILEGVVLSAGQHALLADLADGALPGVRRGAELVERDERWHVAFGLRCMLALHPEPASVAALLDEGEAAVKAWGPAVPAEIRRRVLAAHRRRLAAVGLLPTRAHAAAGRAA